MLQELQLQGIDSGNQCVEPMGVDLENRFTPDDRVPRSDKEILFVGRLVEKKGLKYLIDALPTILSKEPGAKLTIAGFGPQESYLRSRVETLGVSNRVEFLGAVPQSRLPDLYRRAAIFVAPFVEAEGGDQEGLGLVTVEAIGCGCPVIVSDLPAVADVIQDASLRVRPADPAALASTIVSLMVYAREELRTKADCLRKQVVSRFDWSARAGAYAQLLLAQIRETRPPS
jgi:glycosyltransferase involved in cell wall biosynthesis